MLLDVMGFIRSVEASSVIHQKQGRTGDRREARAVSRTAGRFQVIAAGHCATLYVLLVSVAEITAIWKTSCIVPVPKKPNAKALKDRPIALTSHVMKCFERTVLGHLRAQVSAFQDPLQFA